MTSLGFKITGAITIVFLVLLIAISIWGYIHEDIASDDSSKKFFGALIAFSFIAVVFVVNALPELI